MFVRILNVSLLLGFLFGAIQTFQLSAPHAELRDEYDRLVRKVGRLEVTDPDKIYLMPLESDDPLHFKWRCRLPKLNMLKIKTYRGGHSSGSHSSSGLQAGLQVTPQVRIRFSDDHGIQVYSSFVGGSSLGALYPKEFAHFLIKRWDELEIEVAAQEKPLVADPKHLVKLFEIRVPDELVDEFVQQDTRAKPAQLKVPFAIYFGDAESPEWKQLEQ